MAGGGGLAVDPLVGLNDTSKPLRSRLLAVPSLRTKYLEHVKSIAKDWLDWKQLGPLVAEYRSLIESEVEADTRKLTSYAAFQAAVSDVPAPERAAGQRGGESLRSFAQERRRFLLEYAESQPPARAARD